MKLNCSQYIKVIGFVQRIVYGNKLRRETENNFNLTVGFNYGIIKVLSLA